MSHPTLTWPGVWCSQRHWIHLPVGSAACHQPGLQGPVSFTRRPPCVGRCGFSGGAGQGSCRGHPPEGHPCVSSPRIIPRCPPPLLAEGWVQGRSSSAVVATPAPPVPGPLPACQFLEQVVCSLVHPFVCQALVGGRMLSVPGRLLTPQSQVLTSRGCASQGPPGPG